MTDRQRKELAQLVKQVEWDVDMGLHSTFRTGGRADALVGVETVAELCGVLAWATAEGVKNHVLGGGSNILVVGPRFTGMFIQLTGALAQLSLADAAQPQQTALHCGAGCRLGQVVAFCIQHALTGMEWAIGIPGTLGGAVRMNAGAHGQEIADVVGRVELVSREGELLTFAAEDIIFGYRSSTFPGEAERGGYIYTGTVLWLVPGPVEQIQAKCRQYSRWRRAHQPGGAGTAGSFFKNPLGESAGRLIEAAGLKGFCRGGAQVSPQHANFIVNTGSAEPRDILELKDIVQQKVQAETGIWLEPEVHIYE